MYVVAIKGSKFEKKALSKNNKMISPVYSSELSAKKVIQKSKSPDRLRIIEV